MSNLIVLKGIEAVSHPDSIGYQGYQLSFSLDEKWLCPDKEYYAVKRQVFRLCLRVAIILLLNHVHSVVKLFRLTAVCSVAKFDAIARCCQDYVTLAIRKVSTNSLIVYV